MTDILNEQQRAALQGPEHNNHPDFDATVNTQIGKITIGQIWRAVNGHPMNYAHIASASGKDGEVHGEVAKRLTNVLNEIDLQYTRKDLEAALEEALVFMGGDISDRVTEALDKLDNPPKPLGTEERNALRADIEARQDAGLQAITDASASVNDDEVTDVQVKSEKIIMPEGSDVPPKSLVGLGDDKPLVPFETHMSEDHTQDMIARIRTGQQNLMAQAQAAMAAQKPPKSHSLIRRPRSLIEKLVGRL